MNLSKEIGPAISRDSFDLDSFKAYLASEGTPFVPPSVRSKGARAIMAGANTAASSAGPKGSRSLDTQDPHAQGKDDPRSFRERFFSAIGPAPLGYASPLSNTPFSRAGSQGPSTAVNGTGYPPPPRSGSDDKDTSSGQDKKQVDEELDKDLKLQIETLQHFQGPNISEGYRYLGKSCECAPGGIDDQRVLSNSLSFWHDSWCAILALRHGLQGRDCRTIDQCDFGETSTAVLGITDLGSQGLTKLL